MVSASEKFTVIESERIAGATFDVVRYDSLQGSDDLNVAEKIFFANQAKIYLKMVRVTLQNSELLLEPSALHFMKGNLQLESTGGSIAKGLMRKLSGETFFQSSVIIGCGEIFLKPSFGHYLLFNIDNDGLIFDKRAFYCASNGIEITTKWQRNTHNVLLGEEGFYQTQAKGTGIVVLVSPVPNTELLVYELTAGETLSVDGNFVFVRTTGVSFHAQMLGSVVSGKLLLQSFTGPGKVWLAPTLSAYDQIKSPNAGVKLDHNSGSTGASLGVGYSSSVVGDT